MREQVHIVLREDYDGSDIEGVFKDLKGAEALRALLNSKPRYVGSTYCYRILTVDIE